MERIECPCRPQIVEPLEFDVRDSIKIIYSMRNLNYYPEYFIPIDRISFSITFYTKGREGEFVSKKIGDSYENCKVDNISDVVCLLKDHGLKPGKLMARIVVKKRDEDFDDNISVENYVHDLNIILKDNKE
jgi:hypothetical protein|nr:MAG TPA: hypothetical protein [Bacteriophage sp.]